MDAHQKVIEGEVAVNRDYDLTVQDKLLRTQIQHRSNKLRKVAAEGQPGFRLEFYLGAVAESKATKPVPLGLVLPLAAGGNFRY